MPELPEVEAARRAVQEHCLGKTIKNALIADDPKVIDGVSPSDFEASLLGKTIVSAHRKGKNLWLRLDSPPFPSFQFGMAGAIYIKGVAVTKYKRSAVKDSDEWPSKYSKIFIQLDDGLELSFTDKRRFAKVRLLKDPSLAPPISELGPDALLEPMTVDEFSESLSKKKTAIKALLLDQGYISGIGNWIADEVLYQARIHPLQIASSLSKESSATLQKCIKEVCTVFSLRVHAILRNLGRETFNLHGRYRENTCRSLNMLLKLMPIAAAFLSNGCFIFGGAKRLERLMVSLPKQLFSQVIEKALEVGADSSQYPKNWIFHSREKKPGKAFVDGKKIDFISAGGRTTAYVPDLQKLNGSQAGKASGKQRKSNSKRKVSRDDEEPPSEEEETTETAKTKKAPTKPRGRSRKPPMEMKSASDEDDKEDSADDHDDTDDHDEDGNKEKRKKSTNKRAKVEKKTKKRVQSSRDSKAAKRKSK